MTSLLRIFVSHYPRLGISMSRRSSQSRDRWDCSRFPYLSSSKMSQVFSKCSVFAERYTEWSLSGNKRLLHAGTTRGYFARNRYVAISFPHGQCYPFLGGAISVLHIYCLDSTLISSVVIIVAFACDCFLYIWVICRCRRAISFLLGSLASTWHRFYFVVRKAVLRNPRVLKNIAL